jgi:hypothetical protein
MNHHQARRTRRTIAGAVAVLTIGTAIAVAGATVAPEPISKTAADAIERVIASNGGAPAHTIHCPDTFAPVIPCSIEYADGITIAAHYRPATGKAGTGWPR